MHREVRRAAVVALIASAAASVAAGSAQAAVSLVSLGTFASPIYATAPPGSDTTTQYVVERAGAIRVVDNGATRGTPFLTIPDVDDSGEGGLQSMAFATDYATSGRFYVYLTPDDGTPAAAPYSPIEIREYRRSGADPLVADPASARTVLTIPHTGAANHYGGALQFGPDGYLYIGTGDGGGGGDPFGNGQNADSLLGKLLRIDPRATGGSRFGIPADNPYAGTPTRELIWSSGLRNPFRISFDRLTNDLLIGDVGQNRYEEVNQASGLDAGRGVNFGWNACEGTATYPNGAFGSCTSPALTNPVFSYDHTGGRCSITGGVVSRDPGVEELEGRYVYADFCAGVVRNQQLGTPAGDAATAIPASPNSIVAFGEDGCGRVMVVRLSGAVGRISDGSDGGCFPQAAIDPEPSLPALGFPIDSGSTGAPQTVAPPAPSRPIATVVPSRPATVRLSTRVAARQRVLKSRSLALRIRCSAACSLRVRGRLAVKGRRSIALAGFRRTRVTGTRTYRVALSRKARTAIRAALRAKRRTTVTLTIEARGSANRTTATRRVRIIG